MKTINFNNHKFQISVDGILFWFDKQIAIISDLHLEKGSSFGPSGQFLPPYDSEETLTKLLNTIDKFNIAKIILLGDTFHDKNIKIVRPGFGECPSLYEKIIGKKATKDLKKGTPLKLENIIL